MPCRNVRNNENCFPALKPTKRPEIRPFRVPITPLRCGTGRHRSRIGRHGWPIGRHRSPIPRLRLANGRQGSPIGRQGFPIPRRRSSIGRHGLPIRRPGSSVRALRFDIGGDLTGFCRHPNHPRNEPQHESHHPDHRMDEDTQDEHEKAQPPQVPPNGGGGSAAVRHQRWREDDGSRLHRRALSLKPLLAFMADNVSVINARRFELPNRTPAIGTRLYRTFSAPGDRGARGVNNRIHRIR